MRILFIYPAKQGFVMYFRIRLTVLVLCLACSLMALPAIASAHGTSGSAVSGAGPGEGHSAGPDSGSPATEMAAGGNNGEADTDPESASWTNYGSSGACASPGNSLKELEGGATAATGFSETGADGNFAQGFTPSGSSLTEMREGGNSFNRAADSDSLGAGSFPDETPGSGRGTGDVSDEYQVIAAFSAGPRQQNQGISPGKNGDDQGILSSPPGNDQNKGNQQKSSDNVAGSQASPNNGQRQSGVKASASPFQGTIIVGTVAGAAGGMGRDFHDSSPVPPDSRGPGRSFPEPPRGNPCGDPPTKQLPPATTGAEPEVKNPVVRTKGKREEDLPDSQGNDETEPRQSHHDTEDIYSFILFPLFGYRRIHKKNVLCNEGRNTIFRIIDKNPGVDVVTISDAAGMNVNTVRYHLVKLIATGKVTYLTKPGIHRYYPNQGRYSPFEQLVIHYLRNPSTSAILALLLEQPGITRQNLAEDLGISGPTVTRHMQQLIDDRIAVNLPEGSKNHYRLSSESAAVVEGLKERLSTDQGHRLATVEGHLAISSQT
jgi:predicted ArsR family transcriptional regulator